MYNGRMKTCKDCSIEKVLSAFGRSKFSEDKKSSRCRECDKIRTSKMTAYEKSRNKNLLYLYGLELEDYESLLSAQGGVCLICSSEPTNEPLLVDHCHNSLEVRGLLCRDCNTGLARFKDSIELLDRAKSYLLVD